jgi:hypothetical protein
MDKSKKKDVIWEVSLELPLKLLLTRWLEGSADVDGVLLPESIRQVVHVGDVVVTSGILIPMPRTLVAKEICDFLVSWGAANPGSNKTIGCLWKEKASRDKRKEVALTLDKSAYGCACVRFFCRCVFLSYHQSMGALWWCCDYPCGVGVWCLKRLCIYFCGHVVSWFGSNPLVAQVCGLAIFRGQVCNGVCPVLGKLTNISVSKYKIF